VKYGLIGEHLSHSYSCEIHSALADYTYELTELRPEEVCPFLKKRSFHAVNVTIPYKQTVIPFLDHISDSARTIGAVNTIVNRNGVLFGYNTDFYGMKALAERVGVPHHGNKLLILGTGGTSRTAAAVGENLGYREIYRVSRSGKNGSLTYAESYEQHRDADCIINATPVGMYPGVDPEPLDLHCFPCLKSVLDVVYNPLRTGFVLQAKQLGIPSAGGLYMLSAQAVEACGLFLNRTMAEEDILRAFRLVKGQKQNIVLIGMPSSGKTSVGQYIARKTGKEFVDTDQLLLPELGMPIADFFHLRGEAEFRELEHRIIARCSLTGGKVIATGGGAVLRGDNVKALQRNGILVFLDRSPDKLVPTDDRPLALNREAVMQRYQERYELYKAAADLRINGDGTVEETGALVLQMIRNDDTTA